VHSLWAFSFVNTEHSDNCSVCYSIDHSTKVVRSMILLRRRKKKGTPSTFRIGTRQVPTASPSA